MRKYEYREKKLQKAVRKFMCMNNEKKTPIFRIEKIEWSSE